MSLLENLKNKNEAPNWLTVESLKTLQGGYLLEGETPRAAYRRVAKAASERLGALGLGMEKFYEDKFFDLMWKNWLCPSTPVLANMGTDRGLPISCFGSYVPDTLVGIMDSVKEVAMMSKYGGGTSGYFGDIRGAGAPVKGTGGLSNGTIAWLKIFDSMISSVSQGGVRRGAFAGYEPIEHKDAFDFMRIRRPEGDPNRQCLNLHHGVSIGDDFMQKVIDGSKAERKLWLDLLKTRSETGEPYIFFRDTVNKADPEWYKKAGWSTKNSNLCVSGDQRIVTNRGYLTAKELAEQGGSLLLFDNEFVVESSPVILRETSAKIYKITLENGMEHKVTSYHGLPVVRGRDKTVRVEAKDIRVGDKILIQTKKGIFGPKHMPDEAFLLGLYQGDGTQYEDTIFLDLWENDFDLIGEIEEKFSLVHKKYKCDSYSITNSVTGKTFSRKREAAKFSGCVVAQSTVKKKRLGSKTLHKALNFKKGDVPSWIWEADEETVWQYVRGLLYTDGTVRASDEYGYPCQLSLASIDFSFLQKIQLLFNNLGLQSSIGILRKSGPTALPDGKGGYKEYEAQTCYRLMVSNKKALCEIDKNTQFLRRKKVKLEDREYRDNTKKSYKVKSIEILPEEPVYCPTVFNDRHLFVCNGLITFNCSEIMLSVDEKRSFVCCLSSLNLARWDEFKDTDTVFMATIFLDAVMTEFIQKAAELEGMEKAVRFAKESRALGLGVLGWHTLLQEKQISFDSFQAMQLNAEVFKKIETDTIKASRVLAEKLGEPELMKGFGRRNSHLVAVAPTASNSILSGNVSPGIEPIAANAFVKKTAKGVFIQYNPILKKLLALKGKDDEDTWKSIVKNEGSVQQLSFLTKEEKEVFLTAREINQYAIIKQAAQRQKWIDQGQSVNLFFASNSDPKYINGVHIAAWKEGLKTLYYFRSSSPLKADMASRDESECRACEG